MFSCQHDCFQESDLDQTTEGSVADDDDIISLSRLVRNGLDLDVHSYSFG